MDTHEKTKEQLIIELQELQQANNSLKVSYGKKITEHKQAEEALRASDALLQSAINILPVGLWVFNAEGKIVISSAVAQQIWAGVRYLGVDQLGEYKGWRTDSGKLIEAHEWAGARALMKGETSIEEEVEIECFDGTHKIILDTAVPLFKSDGSIDGAITINQDITERKRANLKLEEQNKELAFQNEEKEKRAAELIIANKKLAFENKEKDKRAEELIIVNNILVFQNKEREKRAAEYKDIYDNAIEGMFRTSLEGKSIQSNKAFAKMLGYDTADDVVNSVNNYGHQVWANTDERLKYSKILEKQDIVRGYECQYKRVDGGIIWISLNSRLVRDKNGKALYYEGFVEDITERKQTEFELIKAKEHAEESDRLKSAFLTNMSHEIRTPMNGILGFTELLKEPKLTSDEQLDYIQIIQISGARMLNTINNIVDMSKIESGLIQVDIKETNINEKMEFTYKFFKPEVEIKGLQFLLKKSLPSKEAIIKTDNEKVYGILTNLVRNALKFTYEGSIEFGYEKKGEYLEFFVKDTGVGIPDNQKKLIFERFRQGSESHNRGYEGSGLGLSIAKSYVNMLGGEIWVESEEGNGSTFYFTIPYNACIRRKDRNRKC